MLQKVTVINVRIYGMTLRTQGAVRTLKALSVLQSAFFRSNTSKRGECTYVKPTAGSMPPSQ